MSTGFKDTMLLQSCNAGDTQAIPAVLGDGCSGLPQYWRLCGAGIPGGTIVPLSLYNLPALNRSAGALAAMSLRSASFPVLVRFTNCVWGNRQVLGLF